MPTLKLTRPFGLRGLFTRVEVKLNGEPLGHVGNGRALEAEIPAETCVLTVQYQDYTVVPDGRSVIEIDLECERFCGIPLFRVKDPAQAGMHLFCPFLERVDENIPADFTREQRAVAYVEELWGDSSVLLDRDGNAIVEALEEVGAHEAAAHLQRLLDGIPGGYTYPMPGGEEENLWLLDKAWSDVFGDDEMYDRDEKAARQAMFRYAIRHHIA